MGSPDRVCCLFLSRWSGKNLSSKACLLQARKKYELLFKRFSKHFLGWKKASGPERDPVIIILNVPLFLVPYWHSTSLLAVVSFVIFKGTASRYRSG